MVGSRDDTPAAVGAGGGRGGQEPGGPGAHGLWQAGHGAVSVARWMGHRDTREG